VAESKEIRFQHVSELFKADVYRCHSSGGRLFQILGPATENSLSPKLFCVRETTNVIFNLCSLERFCQTNNSVSKHRIELKVLITTRVGHPLDVILCSSQIHQLTFEGWNAAPSRQFSDFHTICQQRYSSVTQPHFLFVMQVSCQVYSYWAGQTLASEVRRANSSYWAGIRYSSVRKKYNLFHSHHRDADVKLVKIIKAINTEAKQCNLFSSEWIKCK